MFKNLTKTLSKVWETYLLTKRHAGHSKWQNIKHIKGVKDAQRSLLFTRLSRQIKVAVQEGGSTDPQKNMKLEQVINQAKRANMPAATVQSVLKSCQNDKSQSKTHIIEIKGPGSCFILCEVYTSQLHQLKQNMATILKKHQSRFGEGGGMHFFEEKGIIEAAHANKNPTNEAEALEIAMEHAIESGAEDVKILEDNLLEFLCGKTNLNQVVKGLEGLNYTVTSASIEYIPLKLQHLQDKELDVCKSLYEKLESLPDVVRLSDNIA